MRVKRPFTLAVAGGLIFAAAATVYAAGVSPYGQFGSFDKAAMTVDRSPIEDKAVIIDGKLFVPADVLRDQNKLAYYYDGEKYLAHLFLGGANSEQSGKAQAAKPGQTLTKAMISSVMSGISYEADRYHAGMMRQDIINISTLAKALLDTSRSLDHVVYAKLTFNRDPDLKLLKQTLTLRSLPFEVMDERMEALAEELGKQVGSSSERKMNDVIEELQEAIKKKEKALDALEDWIRSSDEDDLEDFRDYEEDAKDSITSAVKDLTGEDLVNDPPKNDPEDSLKGKVEEWARKQQQ